MMMMLFVMMLMFVMSRAWKNSTWSRVMSSASGKTTYDIFFSRFCSKSFDFVRCYCFYKQLLLIHTRNFICLFLDSFFFGSSSLVWDFILNLKLFRFEILFINLPVLIKIYSKIYILRGKVFIYFILVLIILLFVLIRFKNKIKHYFKLFIRFLCIILILIL